MTTAERIDGFCLKLAGMLKAKNAAYGDQALNPKVQVFSKLGAVERLEARLDEKLARMKHGGDDEDTLWDLIGYMTLLHLAKSDVGTEEDDIPLVPPKTKGDPVEMAAPWWICSHPNCQARERIYPGRRLADGWTAFGSDIYCPKHGKEKPAKKALEYPELICAGLGCMAKARMGPSFALPEGWTSVGGKHYCIIHDENSGVRASVECNFEDCPETCLLDASDNPPEGWAKNEDEETFYCPAHNPYEKPEPETVPACQKEEAVNWGADADGAATELAEHCVQHVEEDGYECYFCEAHRREGKVTVHEEHCFVGAYIAARTELLKPSKQPWPVTPEEHALQLDYLRQMFARNPREFIRCNHSGCETLLVDYPDLKNPPRDWLCSKHTPKSPETVLVDDPKAVVSGPTVEEIKRQWRVRLIERSHRLARQIPDEKEVAQTLDILGPVGCAHQLTQHIMLEREEARLEEQQYEKELHDRLFTEGWERVVGAIPGGIVVARYTKSGIIADDPSKHMDAPSDAVMEKIRAWHDGDAPEPLLPLWTCRRDGCYESCKLDEQSNPPAGWTRDGKRYYCPAHPEPEEKKPVDPETGTG